MFVPLGQRGHLASVIEMVQEPMPKCLDAIRLLRDRCMHDPAERERAGPAGAVEAQLHHCRSQDSTNRSKIMAVEAIALLCDGNKANKKMLGELHGVQTLVSMLEFPSQRNSSQLLDITNADTISAIKTGDSQAGRDQWVQDKKAELILALPPPGGSLRITPALRRALNRFGCIAPKGTTHSEACLRLALAMRDAVAERVLLQEQAALALWVLCGGGSDQEAFLCFVLGKAGGVGALMDLMEHSSARAAEFAVAVMHCAVEDNIANRLLFQEAGGLAALCRLLTNGNAGAQEHAVATLRVLLDTSRRSGKVCLPSSKNGSMTSRDHSKKGKGQELLPATPRPTVSISTQATTTNNMNKAQSQDGVLQQDSTEAGVEGLCYEALELGVLGSLVALLEEGSERSKLESAAVIRHICLACPRCCELAVPSGALAALVLLLGEEGTKLPEQAAAALHAVCNSHPANVQKLRSLGGIAALTRVLTLTATEAQEQACGALLAIIEADPPSAFDIGEKGKECVRRLASVDGGATARLRSLAGRTLQMLQMILSSPGVFLAPVPVLPQ